MLLAQSPHPPASPVFRGALAALALLWLPASSISRASADDLTILRAAVEERLSGIRTLEVRYRSHQERLPNSRLPETEHNEIQWTWCLAGQRESLSGRPLSPDVWPRVDWFYDGQRTIRFNYLIGHEQPRDVFIRPEPPGDDAMLAHVSYCIGYRVRPSGISLTEGLGSPSARVMAETNDAGARVRVAEFSAPAPQGSYEYRVIFDPEVIGMPRRFEQRDQQTWSNITVEDMLTVSDPLSGRLVAFPRSVLVEDGREDDILARNRIEIDEVRLNHDIPATRFSPPEFPFGAQVYEYTGRPGEKPRQYLAGGQAAMDAAIEERQAEIQREKDRLLSEGVQFNASQPERFTWTRWLVWLGVACIIGAVVVIVRRRWQS